MRQRRKVEKMEDRIRDWGDGWVGRSQHCAVRPQKFLLRDLQVSSAALFALRFQMLSCHTAGAL